MLHDPGSYAPPLRIHEIVLKEDERTVLRRLGEEIARIAALPVNNEKIRLWKSLNDLKSVRPMVWINEIPWHEMNLQDELTLRAENPWQESLNKKLRRGNIPVESYAG